MATNSSDDEIAAHFHAAPGTEILYDQEGDHGATSKRLKILQHLKHGDSHILLVPQPSLIDPNDPLRWSRAKKWGAFLNACFYSFNGSVTGPIMAAGAWILLPPSTEMIPSIYVSRSSKPKLNGQ